jgi:hypothetical protein
MSASYSNPQRGSSLFIILIAIALFVALSFALSQGGRGTQNLSTEKIRLLAGDVIDMGNGLSDATGLLRLRKIQDTSISFENSFVAGYTNAACSVGTCKVFDYNGGGIGWETPANDVNGGANWGMTANLAIQNIGTSSADLIAVLPDINPLVCARINVLLGIHDAATTPIVIAAVTANQFTGTYAVAPTLLADAQINGQRSGCIQITTASGTAFDGEPLSNTYVFYQVLLAR